MAKMVGKCIRVGPGGLKCSCCGNYRDGKSRRVLVRKVKRNERQKWRKDIRKEA